MIHKALDKLGAFSLWFGVQPSNKAATLAFGLLGNLIAFNVGMEPGRLMARILMAMPQWPA